MLASSLGISLVYARNDIFLKTVAGTKGDAWLDANKEDVVYDGQERTFIVSREAEPGDLTGK